LQLPLPCATQYRQCPVGARHQGNLPARGLAGLADQLGDVSSVAFTQGVCALRDEEVVQQIDVPELDALAGQLLRQRLDSLVVTKAG
jgi:hypothetical protein